jgi:putative transposase
LQEAARRHNIVIHDYEVDKDHVHVVASIPLTMTPMKAANLFKGYTARMLFLACPELRKIYKNGHLWSPGKFMGSLGHITLEKAKKYLEAHHAKLLDDRESQLRSVAEKSTGGRSFRSGRMSSEYLPTSSGVFVRVK